MGVKNTSNDYGTGKTVVSRHPEMPNQLSKTPKNFSRDNYWLKETQDQVDAYWVMRPNHVDVEQEMHFGQEDYETYEVVAQSVKDDKGQIISDDWRRFVFRDIHYDCPIGTKFKVGPGYDTTAPEDDKLIFLVFNKQNELTATNGVVTRRCNGTLGTTYLDNHGALQYHYEPAVQQNLSSTDFHYNKMANDPSGDLTIVVQHNKYTRNYYINQRFIIGYDRVYRISNIDKFYSNDTFHPENVGLITLHMSIDSIGEKDDFATRIAYNDPDDVNQLEEVRVEDYYILVTALDELQIGAPDGSILPDVLPIVLPTGYNTFKAYLYNGDGKQNTNLHLDCEIEGMDQTEMSKYISVEFEADNTFKVLKKRYCTIPLKLRFYLPAGESPVEQLIETILTVSLAGIL